MFAVRGLSRHLRGRAIDGTAEEIPLGSAAGRTAGKKRPTFGQGPNKSGQAMNSTQGRVLVAEDNIAFSKVLRLAFERFGLQVTVAEDGEQALEQLKAKTFDLLVTDEQMPRLCGRALCRRIIDDDNLPDLPVFFCTAKSWELSAEELREELGVVAVFRKPFSPRRVAKTVADFHDQKCLLTT